MSEINNNQDEIKNKDNNHFSPNNDVNLNLTNSELQKNTNRHFSLNHDKNTDDSFYEFYINNNLQNKNEYKHKNNEIITAKYNFLTFLPKALFYQFKRVSTIYFVIIAIINMIPYINEVLEEPERAQKAAYRTADQGAYEDQNADDIVGHLELQSA